MVNEAAVADAAAPKEDDDDSDSDSSISSEAESVSEDDGVTYGYVVDEWIDDNGQKRWKLKCPGNFLLEMNALPFDSNTEEYDLSGTYEYKDKKWTVQQYEPIRLMIHKHKTEIHYMLHKFVQKENSGRG